MISGEERRKQILEAIISYALEHDYVPTTREIAEMVGINTSCVQKHLEIMFAQGLLDTDAEMSAKRAYRITGYKLVKTGK